MQTDTDPQLFDPRHFLDSLQLGDRDIDAFQAINQTIRGLAERLRPRKVLELGAGRTPLFDTSISLPFEFVANDISDAELEYLPSTTTHARFDISSPGDVPAALRGTVDLVYSRSVLEHVRSVDDAMRTTHVLLRNGGIALHFFPTLYASPFVINKLLPFSLTKQVIQSLARPNYERFPARYAQANATPGTLRRWQGLGFRDVQAVRFYGHQYYNRIPILRDIENAFTMTAKRSGWTWYSSFAYIILQK
jgi:SAM-dependent methyltransferase